VALQKTLAKLKEIRSKSSLLTPPFMKTTASYPGRLPSGFFVFLVSIALWCLPDIAFGQLYVGQQGGGSGSVGEYNSHNGAPIAPNLITSGVQNPQGLAVMGNTLFVANQYTSSVGEYDTSTGMAISTNFIPGLSDPGEIALSGSTLFVVYGNNAVGEYNAVTGQVINSDLFYGLSDGLNNPAGLLLALPTMRTPSAAPATLANTMC